MAHESELNLLTRSLVAFWVFAIGVRIYESAWHGGGLVGATFCLGRIILFHAESKGSSGIRFARR